MTIGGWRMAVSRALVNKRVTPRTRWQSLHQHQNIKKYLCHFIIHKKTSVPTRYHRDTQIRTCCPPWTWRLWSGLCAIIITASAPLLLGMEWTRVFDNIAIRVTGQWQFMVHQQHMVHLTQISGMLSLFHTIDYCFFTLMSRPWHGSGNSFRRFFFNGMVIVLFSLFLFVYAEGKAHGRESTAIGRQPSTYFSQAR